MSDGQPANQNHSTELTNLSRHILAESFEQMAQFDGSVGDFYFTNYMRSLRRKEFGNIPMRSVTQMESFHHTRINNYFASLDWYDVSARLLGLKPHTKGSQWVTWRDQGFRTMFDFISVRFAVCI